MKTSASFVFANDDYGRQKALEAANSAVPAQGSMGFMSYLGSDWEASCDPNTIEIDLEMFGFIRVDEEGKGTRTSVLAWMTDLFTSNHPKWKVGSVWKRGRGDDVTEVGDFEGSFMWCDLELS